VHRCLKLSVATHDNRVVFKLTLISLGSLDLAAAVSLSWQAELICFNIPSILTEEACRRFCCSCSFFIASVTSFWLWQKLTTHKFWFGYIFSYLISFPLWFSELARRWGESAEESLLGVTLACNCLLKNDDLTAISAQWLSPRGDQVLMPMVAKYHASYHVKGSKFARKYAIRDGPCQPEAQAFLQTL